MLDSKQFISAIEQIAQEKGIDTKAVFETINAAIAAAYKKDHGTKGQVVRAELNPESGTVRVWQIKYVIDSVDEEGFLTGDMGIQHPEEQEEFTYSKLSHTAPMGYSDRDDTPKAPEGSEQIKTDNRIKFNPEKHIILLEAQAIKPDAVVGDELVFPLEQKFDLDFGRIAAQTAKQVILQRLREAERESIFQEYRNKVGEVLSAVVQRRYGRTIYLDIGRASGLLIPGEQSRADRYRLGGRFRVMLLNVEETNRGPVILLSRSHPDLVKKLFAFEVPEIANGAVEIKAVSREAGVRSKVAVESLQERVDPIGSLVGQKGIRVQTVINELSGEKIDIIQWSEDPRVFIANALAPAKVQSVEVLDERKRHAVAGVAEDQFSLAIGKNGQNVRLAAKLTGWKIDVRSPKEELTLESALASADSDSTEK